MKRKFLEALKQRLYAHKNYHPSQLKHDFARPVSTKTGFLFVRSFISRIQVLVFFSEKCIHFLKNVYLNVKFSKGPSESLVHKSEDIEKSMGRIKKTCVCFF